MKHNFLNLEIWKRSRELCKDIYIITQKLPEEEKFGLRSQIRRSVVSVPSNIAEGCGRSTDTQLKFHLDVAVGSLCELETQLYIATDLVYIAYRDTQLLISEITEIRKMILSFKRYL